MFFQNTHICTNSFSDSAAVGSTCASDQRPKPLVAPLPHTSYVTLAQSNHPTLGSCTFDQEIRVLTPQAMRVSQAANAAEHWYRAVIHFNVKCCYFFNSQALTKHQKDTLFNKHYYQADFQCLDSSFTSASASQSGGTTRICHHIWLKKHLLCDRHYSKHFANKFDHHDNPNR